MKPYIDISYDSINKYGEELCGDNVEIIKKDDSVIIVLSDGLGSGVKANILATLTSKIAITMLKEGASIYETVDTIVHTLPVCKVRNLAYSTFTILKVYNDGRTYIAEYDNPPIFFIKNSRLGFIDKKETIINGKVVKESYINLQEGDLLTVISDGAVHAGVGGVLNLGWQWKNIAQYLCKVSAKEKCAKNISRSLIDTCRTLYMDKPGDDTTVVSLKVRKPEIINLFTGPPKNRDNDKEFVKRFMMSNGKKVVCGGTAATIIARELDKEIKTNLDFIDPDVPPTASIEGIDLVTEGVLTLSKVVEKIKRYIKSPYKDNQQYSLNRKDGASKLAKMLIEDCTHLNLWVGKAINPAHQNPDLPIDLSIKLKVVNQLKELLEGLGINIKVIHI